MILLLIGLFACSVPESPAPSLPARPASVPPGAVHIAMSAGTLTVNGDPINGFDSAALANGVHPPLLDVLSSEHPVWITAPPRTEWLFVRKLFLTSRQAGVTKVWLGLEGGDEAFLQPPGSQASFNRGCKDQRLPITGVDTSLSLTLHTSSNGSWAIGSARFAPIATRGGVSVPIVDLPVSCWAPGTCTLFDGDTARACEEATQREPLASRVPIGGSAGCLSPLLKNLVDDANWRGGVKQTLSMLGIAPNTETLLMVEAQAPWTAVIALLGAFSDQGIRLPNLGEPLIEGHEGPPICDAPIRDRASLQTAAGLWFGSQLHEP
jgi:hypothetical protein